MIRIRMFGVYIGVPLSMELLNLKPQTPESALCVHASMPKFFNRCGVAVIDATARWK